MSTTSGNHATPRRVRIPGKPGLWEADFGGGRSVRLVCLDPSYRETEGAWLTPGLFDIQVNGMGGINFADAALTDGRGVDALARADEAIRTSGDAWYCPTIVTRDQPTTLSLCRTFAEAWRRDAIPGAFGLHIEGPFISSEDGYRGVHKKEYTRDPSITDLEAWQEAAEGRIRIVTLAPERAGSGPFISRARAMGIVVAVGHSSASEAEVKAAVDAGARLSTHLFNGCASMVNRHRNPIFAQLAEDRLWASFVADGHHIPLSVLKIALRAKSVGRSILTSDLAHIAGLPDGEHEMEGAVVVKRDGGLFRKDSDMLSGAVRSLAEDVAVLGAQPEPGIEDTFLMATDHPARLLGADSAAAVREGPGQRLCLWDWSRSRLTLLERIGF